MSISNAFALPYFQLGFTLGYTIRYPFLAMLPIIASVIVLDHPQFWGALPAFIGISLATTFFAVFRTEPIQNRVTAPLLVGGAFLVMQLLHYHPLNTWWSRRCQ